MYKKSTLTIKYSDDMLLSLKQSRREFEDEARYLLALKLYELGKMSSGKAARLAGVSRVEFLMRLWRYKVSPFQVDLEEILKESRDDR